MELTERKPKVSVCVVTYNQEKYIGQCLQSIVDQETDFDFEVIVGDDCSTDGTRLIVQKFAEKYPNMILPVLHKKNIGGSQNYLSVHNLAAGQYVAHCDGDDYWLPGKLNFQATYLDNNPDVIQVWHRVLLIDENYYGQIGMPKKFTGEFGKKMNISDLALSFGLSGQHSSQMYRRSAKIINTFDKEFIDYYIAMSFAKAGKSIILNKVFGVYRIYSAAKSVTSGAAGRLLVDKALIDLVNVFSFSKDLEKRLCSHLFFRFILNVYRGRPVIEIWACLKEHKFAISPIYILRAIRIFFSHR